MCVHKLFFNVFCSRKSYNACYTPRDASYTISIELHFIVYILKLIKYNLLTVPRGRVISAHEMVVSVCPQSYMALLSWRDLAGDSFDLTRLPEALDECGHSDLADLSCRILNSRSPCIGSL